MIKHFIFLLSLTYAHLSTAGGPLVLQGTNGNTPVTYQIPSVTLHVEAGTLGTHSNLAAQALMNDGFALWNNVDTATISLSVNQTLPDIDGTNFELYLPEVDDNDPTTKEDFNADDNLNPVVFDDNGDIIDAYFGEDQSDYIIGFAESIFTQYGNYFLEGYLVINGRQLGSTPRTDEEFILLFAHEIGHFFGLDHSQGNINNQETDATFSPTLCHTSSQDQYPVMYPYECRTVDTLHSDDISAISALYPAANVSSRFGTIEGYFVDTNDTPILGANIWAENNSTGEVISIVSDYLMQGNGYYKLLLPAGNYTLHANSINPVFFGGSSVGPYALKIDSKSFLSPHPIAEVTFQDDTSNSDAIITVTVNESAEINFSSNGGSVSLSSINFNDEESTGGTTAPLTLLLLFFGLAIRHYKKLN